MQRKDHSMKVASLITLLLFLAGCSTSYKPVVRGYGEPPLPSVFGDDRSDERIEDKSLEEIVLAGQQNLKNGNIQLAKAYFAQALNKDDRCLEVYIGLADILWMEQKNQKALELLKKAENIDPKNKKVLLKLSTAYRVLGEAETALSYANQAVLIDQNDPEVLTELAILYDSMGEANMAEPLYVSVVEKLPDSPSALNNLGWNLLLQKRYREATALFRRALAHDPKNPRIRNNLGTAYALDGKEEQALAILEDLLGRAEAMNNLGYFLMTQGEWDKAEKTLKKALDQKSVFYAKASRNLEKLNSLRKESAQTN